MKPKTQNNGVPMNKYDVSIMLLVVFTVVFIIGVWIWFSYKDAQIDKEMANTNLIIKI